MSKPANTGAQSLEVRSANVVLHIPHASRKIPEAVRKKFQLSDVELDVEQFRLTDHFTDELFQVSPQRGQAVIYPVSRMVCDPDRFPDDEKEVGSKYGFGAIYTRTTEGQRLRVELNAEDRAALLETYYRKHHQQLESVIDGILATSGRCLILDCHSFPAVPLPFGDLTMDPADYPDFCFGTDPFHTPNELVEAARVFTEAAGYTVTINRPFAGTIVPSKHYHRDHRVN